MKIGYLEFKGYAALAPMAGVADRAMRELCRSFGAAYCVSELVSAKGVSVGDRKSASLMACSDAERPVATQLFGSDPDIMAEAVSAALKYKPDFLDINMGCPAPKVAGNGGGSALMKNPELAEQITAAAVKASNVPVTVKIRTGWDADSINAVDIAKRCENAGAAAITVHGRTRRQMYAPPVDIDTIAAVKRAVRIPVIANGDVTDGPSAQRMYEQTCCDFVMVGRAAMGAPYVFKAINAWFEQGIILPEPTVHEKMNLLIKQVDLMVADKHEKIAYLEARKHAAWYMRGLKGAANLRAMCGQISCFDDVQRICELALQYQEK